MVPDTTEPARRRAAAEMLSLRLRKETSGYSRSPGQQARFFADMASAPRAHGFRRKAEHFDVVRGDPFNAIAKWIPLKARGKQQAPADADVSATGAAGHRDHGGSETPS